MKRSEFRALIREEIKRVISESQVHRGRSRSRLLNLISESTAIENDPVLKKYGFVRLDTPESIKGKLAMSRHFKGVTNVAYFDHRKWGLPTEPFARNEAKRKIFRTIGTALSKHGLKIKSGSSIWDSTNANVPDNFTVYSLIPGKTSPITVDSGNVNGMDREVTGTYNGKPFELTTDDGMTSIYIDGKMVRDGSAKYEEILNFVNDSGYELEY